MCIHLLKISTSEDKYFCNQTCTCPVVHPPTEDKVAIHMEVHILDTVQTSLDLPLRFWSV